MKLANLILQDEGDLIVYQYKGRPLIQLNVKDGRFYTPASEIEAHGREAAQQQARIVLGILKKNGFSNTKREKTAVQANARAHHS